MSGMSADVIRN